MNIYKELVGSAVDFDLSTRQAAHYTRRNCQKKKKM